MKDLDKENDIVIEENTNIADDSAKLDDSVVAEENAAEALKKLREKLKKCEVEKQEYLVGWQRAKADMVNARKRDESERLEFIKFSNERIVSDLIPVLESFDMAMGNKETWEKVEKNWRTGVEYIYSQFRKTLSDYGLQEIDPINQKFDHSLHEASSYEPVNDQNLDHSILEVVQKGYSLNGKVLKAARVKVGEFKK
ncbi:MAG: nucleotide exchange factor GrpE [Candidatus Taylorbacteria bacterium RIFCSPLOWO2_01_FULL_44_26]|uniref:Protein GrpE n=2 Tax=Candidatus Tayloriibacteriota TaxID=1817919 RepID=A0A1G2MJC9_9BACT|nr:MAG: nucleotide exchange factor GrpE [Candidatus Taylorbacteria bacterium RIFCSPHIGHO2_02_FULL_44_12]OHA31409.1 MAG: nucleotide exchange factor GrpE [Candidatus Taylorbacteria bacterium RIFCSPLOWO2_01_FULL_44_26]